MYKERSVLRYFEDIIRTLIRPLEISQELIKSRGRLVNFHSITFGFYYILNSNKKQSKHVCTVYSYKIEVSRDVKCPIRQYEQQL